MKHDGDIKRIGDLDFPEDLRFEQRSWAVERWGQLIVVALVIAAALGLFGGGHLSRQTSADDAGLLKVEHPRFARATALHTMNLSVAPELVREGELRVIVSASLLEDFRVESVLPEPSDAEWNGDGATFSFNAASSKPVNVRFSLRAEGAGPGGGSVAIEGGPSVTLQHFIYP